MRAVTEQSHRKDGIGAYLPALAVLAFSALGTAWLDYRPTDPSHATLALFSPGLSHEDAFAAVARAGGNIVSGAPLPFALIVQSNDPNFFARLRKAGAWLLLDATGRGGCTVFSGPGNSP